MPRHLIYRLAEVDKEWGPCRVDLRYLSRGKAALECSRSRSQRKLAGEKVTADTRLVFPADKQPGQGTARPLRVTLVGALAAGRLSAVTVSQVIDCLFPPELKCWRHPGMSYDDGWDDSLAS